MTRQRSLATYVNNERRRQFRLRVANLSLPAISGTATVGSTLAVTTGEWKSRNDYDLDYAYQWTRDGVDIAGANASTYLLDPADSGTDVACAVTATQPVGPISNNSATAIAAAVAVA